TPHTRHPTALEWRSGPGLITGLAWVGNHLIPPELASGFGVVTGDITAMCRILASASRDDYAVSHDRAGGVANLQVSTAVGLPDQLARAGAQRYDEIVPAYEIDLVAIERDASLTLSERVTERCGRRQRVPILPHQVASRCIDRLDHVAGIT